MGNGTTGAASGPAAGAPAAQAGLAGAAVILGLVAALICAIGFRLRRAYLAAELSSAVVNGQAAEARRLLAAGADPNGTSKAGYSLLADSASAGRQDIAEALLRAGARPDWAGSCPETPLGLAIQNGYTPLALDLLRYGASAAGDGPPGPLSLLAGRRVVSSAGALRLASALLRRGGWSGPMPERLVPVHLACVHENLPLVSLLLHSAGEDTPAAAQQALDDGSALGACRLVRLAIAAGALPRAELRRLPRLWWLRRMRSSPRLSASCWPWAQTPITAVRTAEPCLAVCPTGAASMRTRHIQALPTYGPIGA